MFEKFFASAAYSIHCHCLYRAVSLAEHHLLVMWSAAFYLLERSADEISDHEFKANILKVLSLL